MFTVKQIKITCQAADYVDPHSLKIIQGELKSLDKKRYEKLKDSIEKHGHSFATHVWKSPEGELCVLDGTQRTRVTLKEVDEGRWDCPRVPINYVEASSFKDAVSKLLVGASQYGKAEGQGLYELLSISGLGLEEVRGLELPGIDYRAFEQEFYLEARPEGDDSVPGDGSGPVVEVGDVWQCGEHRIACGDATSAVVIESVMAPHSGAGCTADLVLIDPIYGRMNESVGAVQAGREYSSHPAGMFVFGSDQDMFELARAYPSDMKRLFIFQYDIGLGGAGAYVMHANIAVMFEAHKKFNNLRDGFGSIIKPEERRKESSERFNTGQVKPIALIESLITHYSITGDTVLDLYSGYGTAMLAGERLGRRVRSVELDPKRVSAAIHRWESYTGHNALKL